MLSDYKPVSYYKLFTGASLALTGVLTMQKRHIVTSRRLLTTGVKPVFFQDFVDQMNLRHDPVVWQGHPLRWIAGKYNACAKSGTHKDGDGQEFNFVPQTSTPETYWLATKLCGATSIMFGLAFASFGWNLILVGLLLTIGASLLMFRNKGFSILGAARFGGALLAGSLFTAGAVLQNASEAGYSSVYFCGAVVALALFTHLAHIMLPGNKWALVSAVSGGVLLVLMTAQDMGLEFSAEPVFYRDFTGCAGMVYIWAAFAIYFYKHQSKLHEDVHKRALFVAMGSTMLLSGLIFIGGFAWHDTSAMAFGGIAIVLTILSMLLLYTYRRFINAANGHGA